MSENKTTTAGARTQCRCGVETNVMGRALDGSLHPGKACKAQHAPGPLEQLTCDILDGLRQFLPQGDVHTDVLLENIVLGVVKTNPLIAAAPELLTMLGRYVALEELAAPYSSSPMREAARCAIAKAERRSE